MSAGSSSETGEGVQAGIREGSGVLKGRVELYESFSLSVAGMEIWMDYIVQ